MKQITLSVIGCGRIGKMHVDNILTGFPNVRIKTIVTSGRSAGSALKKWAEIRGIHNISDNVQDVLQDDEIDAVLIAAPSSAHVSLIKQAAGAHKHIFCEKPIAFNLEGIQEAIDAVEKANVKLQVGFNRRFDPNFMRIKQLISEGKIGAPQIIKITNRDPKRPDLKYIPHSGGLFIDFNVHDFDTAYFMTGQEVEEIYARGAALVDPEIAKLNDIDTAIINLKLKNGALCIIDTSREALYGYDQRVEVFGSKGSINAHNTFPTNISLSTVDGVFSDKPYYSFVERYEQAYKNEMQSFFDYLSSDKPSPVDGYDTKKAVAIALAANKSLKENRPVLLSEIL